MEKEIRTMPVTLEVKKDGSNKPLVHGTVSVYNSESNMIVDKRGRKFIEVIEPGFFSGVLDQDVFATIEHDDNKIVGRSSAGTLKITDTPTELRTENDVAPTTFGNDLLVNIGRGEIRGMSFAFQCKDGGDQWERRSGDVYKRTLKAGGCAALLDITYTANPVYSATAVEMRSLDKFEETIIPEFDEIKMNENKRKVKLAHLS